MLIRAVNPCVCTYICGSGRDTSLSYRVHARYIVCGYCFPAAEDTNIGSTLVDLGALKLRVQCSDQPRHYTQNPKVHRPLFLLCDACDSTPM